ncbi:MAG: hypothetical protein P1V36_11295, partial [Planctomycetota bacterium]|nr:hypothetical protein [Planctomycetota bacterium]
MNQTATVALGVLALALLGWFLLSGGMEDAQLPEEAEAPREAQAAPDLRGVEPTPEAPAPSLAGAPAEAPTPEGPPPATPAIRKAPAHSGIFTLRYQEGYSFLDRTVGKEGARDLVLTQLAGGVSSATLEAPAGRIASAGGLRGELKDAKTAFGLLAALLRGHPAKLAKG